jgi:hypothetical protein
MKNTWKHYLRRLATNCVLCGATAWSSAVCYAQVAFDIATDPVYADGWQDGDNGGSGFSPWNFDGTYVTPPNEQQRMDDGLKAGGAGSSQYNDLGRAWSLFNPVFSGNERDLAQAGRGFPDLQVGQTIRTLIDNPTETLFFRGYTVRFNTGGGNTTYNGEPKARLSVGTFEYGTNGQWYAADGVEDSGAPTLFVTDTDQGLQIDVTLTGADTYELVMTPSDTTVAPYMKSGTLADSGPIDWIEFEFYNSLHEPGFDTDFFIRSIEIIGAAPAGVAGDYNDDGTVNAADYVVWRNGGPLMNEVADPGTISTADYDAWRARFGNSSGSGVAASLSTAAVPEPNTFVYLVGAMLGLTALQTRPAARPE